MAKGGADIPNSGKATHANIPAWMDLISAISQSGAIGKTYDKERESTNLMRFATKTSPRIYGKKFDISPIDRQVKAASDPYRQLEFNSSDNRENLAGELRRAKAISDIQEKGEVQKSAAIDQFNASEATRSTQQAAQDAETVDYNRALAVQTDALLKRLYGQEISNK